MSNENVAASDVESGDCAGGSVRWGAALANPHDRGGCTSSLPVIYQRAVVAVFVVALTIAALFIVCEHWRRGVFVVGASMVWLAIGRATCDSAVLGVLSVRSRRFDVAFCFGVGLLVLYLALSMDATGG